MVLAVLVAFGAVVGASEGIQASQRRARREEHRSRKNNLTVHCPKSSAYAPLLEGRRVVLSGGKLYVDTSDSVDPDAPFGHPFAGYYLPYPEARHAGLVSTITDVAPIMNWVYVDHASYELCYGARAASEGHFTGPWDCTRQDRRLTFGGWEGFVAVRLPPEVGGGFWALYFDRDADRLQARLAAMPPGTVAVEVELARRELRTPAPPPPEPVEDGDKEKADAGQKQSGQTAGPESEDKQRGQQSLTTEQVAELQRRLQVEEEAQKQKKMESEKERQRQKQRGKEVPIPEQKTVAGGGKGVRQHNDRTRPITPEAQSVAAADAKRFDTDNASSRSRRSRRSGRSRRSNMSSQSAASAQHSIKTAGTATTKATTATASGSSRSSSALGKDDTDDGYSSSVYSGYFASPRGSSSGGAPATPENKE